LFAVELERETREKTPGDNPLYFGFEIIFLGCEKLKKN